MANAYLVPGGNGNINSSTNWSTTSGGASGYTPVAGDNLIADANSMNAPLATIPNAIYESLTFSNYTGNFTLTSGTQTFRSGLIYSTGMTTSGTGTVNVGGVGMSTAFINFNGVTHTGAFGFNNGTQLQTVYTITGDMNIIGTTNFANGNSGGAGTKITLQGNGRVLMNSSMSIFGNGNRWLGGGTGGVSLHFVGNGSGVFTSGVNAYIFLNITFEKTGGTINHTVGSLHPRGSTVTYVSGNFTNFILNMQHSCTINTAGMVWSAVTTSISFTNPSTLSIQNTLTTSASITISGLGDIYCNTLTNTSSLGLAVGKSLFINSAWNSVATAATPFLIYSTTTGTQVNIVLATNGTQDIAHTNARDINSNGGKTIYSYRVASLTNTLNWATLPIITTVNTKTIAI